MKQKSAIQTFNEFIRGLLFQSCVGCMLLMFVMAFGFLTFIVVVIYQHDK